MAKNNLLSVGDVAKQLGKSASLVRLLEGRGELPAIRLRDGTRIFRQAAVEKYLERQQIAPSPEAHSS